MITDWSSRKVTDLKEECKTRNISITGLKLKQQFVDKLTEYEANSQDENHAEEPQAETQHEDTISGTNGGPISQGADEFNDDADSDVAERTNGAIEEVVKEEAPPVPEPEPESAAEPVEEPSLELLQHDEHLSEQAREERVSESIPLAIETDSDLPSERPATLKVEDSIASNLNTEAQGDDDVPMAETEQEAQEIKDNDIMVPQPEQLIVAEKIEAPLQNGQSATQDDDAVTRLKEGLEESKPDEIEINDRPAQNTVKPVITEQEDMRKRKRRSDSPPIDAKEVQKKAKSSVGEAIITKMTSSTSRSASPVPEDERMQDLSSTTNNGSSFQNKESSPSNDSIEPALHAATRSLYLSNFKRPLNIQALKSHIVTIAKGKSDENPIDFFNINNIRSHAFVTFTSTAAAARVRAAMHNTRFPDDPIREPLFVDYIPDDKAEEWVEQETSGSRGSRNSNSKMEVVYKAGPDGMEAKFEDTSIKRRESFPPRRESFSTGTRATATSGVHPDRVGIVPQQQSPAKQQEERGMGFKDLDDLFQSTKAKPKLYYKLPPQKIIDERLDMLRDLYPDRGVPGAPNMKRYTFEGDGRQEWVDSGPEFGKGKRGMDRLLGTGGRGRGGGGGGGFRGRGRSYAGDSYRGRPRW